MKLKSESEFNKLNNTKSVEKSHNSELMNVLELLELQARARAIRSQLALESKSTKTQNCLSKTINKCEFYDSDPEIIVLSEEQDVEIIISSSDDELKENEMETKLLELSEIFSGSSADYNSINNIEKYETSDEIIINLGADDTEELKMENL